MFLTGKIKPEKIPDNSNSYSNLFSLWKKGKIIQKILGDHGLEIFVWAYFITTKNIVKKSKVIKMIFCNIK